MSVTKLSKSKSLKILLVAIVFVFSFQINMNKPKAFVPLAGYIVPIVGGLIVGEMAEMGIKWGAKAVVKKQADNFASMANSEKIANNLMFARTNPYRNKDGSLAISPSVNDFAKIAGLIAGGTTGLMLEGDKNGDGIPDACIPSPPSGGEKLSWDVPLDNSGNFAEDQRTAWELSKYVAPYVIKNANGTHTFYYVSLYTGAVIQTHVVDNPNFQLVNYKFSVIWSSNNGVFMPNVTYQSKDGSSYRSAFTNGSISEAMIGQNVSVNSQVAIQAGASLIPCAEMIVPSTIKNVYPVPMDMSSTYKMPNASDIKPKVIVINNVFPPGEEGEVTWEDIGNLYPDPKDFADLVDKSVDYDVGTINKPYTEQVINNYYTDINYPIKVIDFKPEIGEPEVTLPEVPKEPVEDLDHSMWEVLRNTYNYLDDGIDSSLAAMKGITDSAKGITNYLASAMGWLPPEWRAVFTSAFVLGVFAHFLRR